MKNFYKYILLLLFSGLCFIVLKQPLKGQRWFDNAATVDDVEEVIEQNPNKINEFNHEGITGVMHAARDGDVGRLELLLQYHADVTIASPQQNNYTALHYACEKGGLVDSVRIVELLLEAGADPNARSIDGSTPLHLLIYVQSDTRRMLLLSRLVGYGADINAQKRDMNTLLHELVYTRNRGVIEKIQGVYGSMLNRHIKNNKALTPGMLAQWYGYDDIVRVLSAPVHFLGQSDIRGVKEERDSQQRTGLMHAILRDDYQWAVVSINEHGADVNARDIYGNTPLHYAMHSYRPREYVQLLLGQGSMSTTNNSGSYPVHAIIGVRDGALKRTLLDALIGAGHGWTCYQQNKNGETLLHLAVAGHDHVTLSYMKELYGRLVRDKDNQTAYDRALKLGDAAIIRLFGGVARN